MLQTDKANEEFADSWLMNSFVWFCHPYTAFHVPQIMQLKLYWIALCVLHYIEQFFCILFLVPYIASSDYLEY